MNSISLRVLVEPSDYVLRNIGDMAMLRVATERLRTLLPEAELEVLTNEPDALRSFCPSATPLDAYGRSLWLGKDSFRAALRRLLPAHDADAVRSAIPWPIIDLFERLLRGNTDANRQRSQFVNSIMRADLVVVAGMGGITDYFPDYANALLDTLAFAIRSNRKVAMLGQGVGPLENARLRGKAAQVLSKVNLIALREKLAGEPLLRELGVDARRVVFTGDDAIEMAYALRSDRIGAGLGINVRQSAYSAIDRDDSDAIGVTLNAIAKELEAPLIPVPVSLVTGEADIETLRSIMPDRGQELDLAYGITSPGALIGQIKRCRAVVTGSYHAGVFALANGIPIVGVARSTYYLNKFEGLADIFGDGCAVVRLREPNQGEDLRTATLRQWQNAESVRPALLAAAEAQIVAGKAAYEKLVGLVTDAREEEHA